MKKWILFTIPLLILLAGCTIPGTATLNIINEMTGCRKITALYLYEQGASDKGSSIISSHICPNENHTQYGVYPGEYVIEAEIDDGAETAIVFITAEADTYHLMCIYDSDII